MKTLIFILFVSPIFLFKQSKNCEEKEIITHLTESNDDEVSLEKTNLKGSKAEGFNTKYTFKIKASESNVKIKKSQSLKFNFKTPIKECKSKYELGLALIKLDQKRNKRYFSVVINKLNEDKNEYPEMYSNFEINTIHKNSIFEVENLSPGEYCFVLINDYEKLLYTSGDVYSFAYCFSIVQ